jgi:biotin operon repressor
MKAPKASRRRNTASAGGQAALTRAAAAASKARREKAATLEITSDRDLARHGRIGVYWAVKLAGYPCALAVAIVLSSYARTEKDGRRVCWPSQGEVAQVLGITEKSVGTAIKTLRSAGFIEDYQQRFRRSAKIFLLDYLPANFHLVDKQTTEEENDNEESF